MFCLVYATAAEVAFPLHIKANTSSATTQVQKYFGSICVCANLAEEFGMLLSSEPASQNWSSELMHATSSVCWKSTPVPCAHDTIVLVPPLQATAHTQACCVAWLRRPASLHWRCDACLCINHKICNTLTNSRKGCAASLAGSRGTIV